MTGRRVAVAFTRLDRWIGLAIAILVAAACAVVWMSGQIIAPPRPRVSESERPTLGLAVRDLPGRGVGVVRASGPSGSAGLRKGDRIVAIDELRDPDAAAFDGYVAGLTDGQAVRIDARRGTDGVLAEVFARIRPESPADLGLPYEDVSFRNAAGLTLRGWYVPPPADGAGRAPAIAWGHGNAADRRHMLAAAVAVHDGGFAQLFLDFTGRGESDGEVITLGPQEAADLRAGLDFLTARPEVDPRRLALGGRSMGAVAAILEAADDPRVEALVLDSPFADLPVLVDRAIGGHHLPPFLVRPVLLRFAGWRANFDPYAVRPVEAIRKIGVPVLLLHGTADGVVPFSDAEALKAAGKRVTLVRLEGQGHNDRRPSAAIDRMVAFLNTVLGN